MAEKPDDHDLSYTHRVLLETDRLYFELGARRSSRSGLDLLYVPDHVASPSGAVVWGVDRQCGTERFSRMLGAAESELERLGGQTMRVYVEDPVPGPIAEAFEHAGYRPRVEVALLAPVAVILETSLDGEYSLVEVETEQQWRLKEALHAQEDKQADGYAAGARDWVGLERLKCATGGMSCFLVMHGEQAVAAVGLLLDRGIARLKNLWVSPTFRRGGVGLATIRLLAAKAGDLGYQAFGCYALENGKAVRVYRRAGLRVVAAATEFSRELRVGRPA